MTVLISGSFLLVTSIIIGVVSATCHGTEVFLCIWILLVHANQIDCCSLSIMIIIILPNLGFITAQFSFITAQVGSDTPIF